MCRKLGPWVVLCFFILSCVALEAQQAMEGVHQPPKVLVISREWIKPGKAGSPHERTESAFVSAFTAAKWPQRYLAMDSQTGAPRMLFFAGYPTFEAWQADSLAIAKNATLSAALDKAAIGDADSISGIETSAFMFREDMSLNPGVNIPKMRYMEISLFKVRPGHEGEWHAVVKAYQDGFKDIPDTHWAVYQGVYSNLGDGSYLVITPMASAAEIDKGFGNSKKFTDALGPEGMKKLGEQAAACIESSQTNLFMFNPKLSYVPDEWKKADSFWGNSKPAAAPAKKAAQKPKQ